MKLVWMPQWFCQNYDRDGDGHGEKCPYCPYGFRNGRLVFETQETASNKLADHRMVLAFFRRNAGPLGSFLEISGGEPLLYPHLDGMLGEAGLPGWAWAITSNTLHTPMIRRLADSGALARCVAWAASYHPLAGTEEVFASNVQLLRSLGARYIHSTVTVSKHTVDHVPRAIRFVSSLGLNAFQFHLDSHGDLADNEAFRERLAELAPGVRQLAGDVPIHIRCNRNAVLLALGADGTLYHCVTKAYRNLDPICQIQGELDLAQLPTDVTYCGVPCFAVCDHVKHVERLERPPAAPPRTLVSRFRSILGLS